MINKPTHLPDTGRFQTCPVCILIIFLLCLICPPYGLSQIPLSGDLSSYVSDFISNPSFPVANGNDYQHPVQSEAMVWENCIALILDGDYSTAHSYANEIGYRLIEFTDASAGRVYYILEKQDVSENHWGMFVYNPSASRPRLFIQSPHPKYDSYTGLQGAYIFKHQDCGAFFVSGTHRCNSETDSNCSGTSSVCGPSGPYKISDQPHTVDGTLFLTTEVVNNIIMDLIVIQPHGFAKGETDPHLIMSNGTRTSPTPDYLASIRDNLLSIDNSLTFKIAHIDTGWDRLIAFTNTQGRLINNSSNPCTNNATACTGRFIHIEQAYSGLRDTEASRKKLSDAIGMTFSVETGLTLTSPEEDNVLIAGTFHEITWQTTGSITHIKLEYSIDNGASWITLEESIANTGSYEWTVPHIGTWGARVRVSDKGQVLIRDETAFRIDKTVYPTTGSAVYVKPVSPFGPRLLTGVYDFHRGLDFAGDLNDPVYTSKPGIIVRYETAEETEGTARERFGNWILVEIDSDNGTSRHHAYLHLNGFNGYSVGDTMTTLDTIGFMGSSGVGINTVHLHFELYKDLDGININKDKAQNPFELLPYNDENIYGITFLSGNDSSGVEVIMRDTELDFDEITIYGTLATRTVGFNRRTGIDPDNNDNSCYNGVYIKPLTFNASSEEQTLRFWTKDNETGQIKWVKITDVIGNVIIASQIPGGTRYAVANGNWSDAVWASTPEGTPGSASIPTSINNAHICENIVVQINIPNAECDTLLFSALSSKINFTLTSAVLSLYGDFTPFSLDHTPFSGWTNGAVLRFTGPCEVQTIHYVKNDNSATDMVFFKTLEIDKEEGIVTYAGSSDSKLNVSDAIIIKNGTFQIPAAFDINGRSFNGTAYAYPEIVIKSGGTFKMLGGASQIVARSGTAMQSIGKMTVSGTAIMASTSSNRIRIDDIDVEDGGILSIPYYPDGGNMGTERFDPGIFSIKSGGKVTNALNTNIWYGSSVVKLQGGAVYEATSSNPVLPVFSENLGTICYARTSDSEQRIVDTDYYHIKIKYAEDDAIKIWTLGEDRTIHGDITIDESAQLILSETLGINRTLTVNGRLSILDGSVTNTDDRISIILSETGSLEEVTGNTLIGKIQTTRTVYQSVNNTFGGLGVEINAAGAAPGVTTVMRTTGTAPTGGGNEGIKRWFDINPSTNTGLDASFVFHYDDSEINSLTENALGLYRSDDEGVTWHLEGGTVDAEANTITLSGVDAFSRWTAGDTGDNSLPVTLDAFTAKVVKGTVILEWRTSAEIENQGFVLSREERGASIEKDGFETRPEIIASFTTDDALKGQGTTTEATIYTFTDRQAEPGKAYVYTLYDVDYEGREMRLSQVEVEVKVEGAILADNYSLSPAYPNPFNATLTLPFMLQERMNIEISLYDVSGRMVKQVVNQSLSAGDYSLCVNSDELSSGLYIIKIIMNQSTHYQRVVLLK